MREGHTKFMSAREAFHAVRSADTAQKYVDAALVEKDFGSGPRGPVLVAVAAELKAAGFDDEAERVVK